jgi:glucose dehydrogenase
MKDKNFIIFIFCSAFLMLGTSAYFSIVGISSLFSGRKFFAGILATAMEFSKVTMTSHLTRN